jgi:hypothetical protein
VSAAGAGLLVGLLMIFAIAVFVSRP